MSIAGNLNCFICKTCPIETETFSGGEDGKDSKLFALKVIWEIPPGHLTERSNGLELCEKCLGVVNQAQQLYLDMVKILEQFRKIQRQLVNEIRGSRGRRSSQSAARRNDNNEGPVKWREFIFEHEYDFTGPFAIRVGEDYEADFEFKEECDSSDDEQEKADVAEHLENINSYVSFSDPPSELNSGLSAERIRESGSSLQEIIIPEMVEIKSEDEMSDCDWEPSPTESMLSHNSDGDYTSNVSMEILQQNDTSPSRRNDRRAGRKRKLEKKTYGGEDDTISFSNSQSRRHGEQVNIPGDECTSTSSLSRASRQYKETRKQKRKFVPSPEKLAVCELCEKELSKTDIRDHMLNHVGEEYLHKCPNSECPLAYSSSFALYKHLLERNCSNFTQSRKFLKEMRKVGVYTCKMCPSLSRRADASGLRGHLRLRHEVTEKTHSCPVSGCQEKFTVRQSVDVHIFLQHDMIQRAQAITIQKCNTCSRNIRMKEMADHLKIEHGAKEIIKCGQCTYLFSSRDDLCSHLNASHKYSGVPFICDICTGRSGKDCPTFKNHLLLRKHYFTDHEQACQKFQCQLCEDKVFWTEKILKKHMKIHEGFTCDICNGISSEANVTFPSKEALDRHNIRVHGKEPHKCKFCQMTFTSSQPMQAHIREAHKRNSTEPIKCDIDGCGKVFRTMRALGGHQKFIHGDIAHVCAECGKGYTTAKSLEKHYKTIHLNYRAHVCECCGRRFINVSALKRHRFIHTGEKPFECLQCGKKFRQKEALTKHLKSHEEKE